MIAAYSGVFPTLRALTFYTVLEAIGNRMAWITGAFLLTGFLLTEFLAGVALTETRALQAGFLAAILRLSAVSVLAVFVVTSALREFQDKGVELVLSLPVPRWVYLVGKLTGFSVLALALALGCGLVVSAYAPWLQSVLWGVSLGCELLIVTVFCFLCLLTFNQVTSALFGVGVFYVCARTIEALQFMSEGNFAPGGASAQVFIEWFIKTLALLLPNLSAFAQTEWLVYASGNWSVLVPVFAQTIIYLLFLVGVSLIDLYRKVF